jgi:hypothetical protein
MRAILASVLVLAACGGGEGYRVEVISMERPPDGLGLRPPVDYTPCYYGEARAFDTNGDGTPDKVRISFQGKDRCYGEDADHDGKIDTWDLLNESGQVVRRAHDSNGDGRVDQAWTFDPERRGCAAIAADENADGKADLGEAFDICKSLGAKNAPPPKGDAGAPVTR